MVCCRTTAQGKLLGLRNVFRVQAHLRGFVARRVATQRRRRYRAQAHVRGFVARRETAHRLKRLHIEGQALSKAEALFRMYITRARFKFMCFVAIKCIQGVIRRRATQSMFLQYHPAVFIIQRFCRMGLLRVASRRRSCMARMHRCPAAHYAASYDATPPRWQGLSAEDILPAEELL